MRKSLLLSCATWPYNLQQRACPYPIVVPCHRLIQLEHLHRLLSSAVLSIVERWWTDEEARFWERMPVEKPEEDVLRVTILSFESRAQANYDQWIDGLDQTILPAFRSRQGSWRPDFLLENVSSIEQYRICEINGRFAFNGFLHSAFGQQAFVEMEGSVSDLFVPAAEPKKASVMPNSCLQSMSLPLLDPGCLDVSV